MRLATALSLVPLAVFTICAPGWSDESFPHTAYISDDRCQVRSGPGDQNYVTDHLSRGDAVEVYQRAPGGWLAIRPPKTSFSWVAQRDVMPSEVSQVAKVASSSAVCWIGSNLENVTDHKWLIKLELDEPVSILGQERRKMVADGKTDVYCKIMPPAGEFRWIHEDDVVPTKDDLNKRDAKVVLADLRVAVDENTRTDSIPTDAAKTSLAPTRDDFTGRRAELGRTAKPAAPRDANERIARTQKPDAKPELLRSDNANLESGLRDLDARLSLMVAQSVEKWEFSQLRKEADQMATRATSTLERARLQVFLDKVDDFESLKSRHALFAPSPEAGRSTKPVGDRKDTKAGADEKGFDPRFDGTGWLLPVYSKKRPSPPYALLDKEGNILQFVSPAPGLNLNRYLRKEVGIFGQKGQSSTLEKPHLTAHRVVELDRHR